jgi:hypothetical protein
MNRIYSAFSLIAVLSFVFPANSAISHRTTSFDIEQQAEALSSRTSFEDYLDNLYDEIDLKKAGLSYDVFKRAATGFFNLKEQKKLNSSKNILSVVDFGKHSSQKRLWVIDMEKKKILFHSLVAHGNGSGNATAEKFSNIENSHMSSLGFYVTENTYSGKHGLSLKLNGLDRGYNTNAKRRAVVVHGADYVSEAFVKQHGRLGRSQGCPALPKELSPKIIATIKGGTCLYIDAPNQNYASAYLDTDSAIKRFETEILAQQAKLLSR